MPTYMQGHHASVLRSHEWRTAENSAAYLLPHVRPGMRVLDVGCGPGSITADLAEAVGPEGDVLGIDASAEVVRRAATRTTTARFAVGDVMDLDFADAAFDAVHAHQVLQHLRDPIAALREMARVTRPDGLIAARDADYGAMTWYPSDPALERWRSTYTSVARSHGAEPDAGRRLLSWARAAGLHHVIPGASLWCFATAEERQWWGRMQADRIVDSDIARHAVDAAVATHDELRRMASAWRTWAETDHGWFVVVHGEVLCRVPAASS
jgi:SAM-dependent methyltransferase